jgi:hypothetical protein
MFSLEVINEDRENFLFKFKNLIFMKLSKNI